MNEPGMSRRCTGGTVGPHRRRVQRLRRVARRTKLTYSLRVRLLRKLTRPPRRPRGRILAVKWGLNPNSSSLGVDVTFLLFGAAALSIATPLVAALIRWRKPAPQPPAHGAHNDDPR